MLIATRLLWLSIKTSNSSFWKEKRKDINTSRPIQFFKNTKPRQRIGVPQTSQSESKRHKVVNDFSPPLNAAGSLWEATTLCCRFSSLSYTLSSVWIYFQKQISGWKKDDHKIKDIPWAQSCRPHDPPPSSQDTLAKRDCTWTDSSTELWQPCGNEAIYHNEPKAHCMSPAIHISISWGSSLFWKVKIP